MTTVAQLLLKHGVMTSVVQHAMSADGVIHKVVAVVGSGAIWLGVGFYFISMVAWLNVLSRIDVTIAYPFVGLGFIVTMLFGFLILGESLTPAKVAGTVLVAVGVILVGQS